MYDFEGMNRYSVVERVVIVCRIMGIRFNNEYNIFLVENGIDGVYVFRDGFV